MSCLCSHLGTVKLEARGQKAHTEGSSAAGQEKLGDLRAQRTKDLSPELFGENCQQLSVV